ncbi:hypothetical protein CJ030_MR4G011988 [Morella rubra]|uniref:Uncharacterized protein n=1 Tax=Morella rubra TaxID=262757 RepID=A0A6A1VTE2_9ROSI|nr:hypothetical protein CJ030_MR4G011988 [Morella rubra]
MEDGKEKEKQVPIDRAELYKAVHSRFDGSPMNPDVAEKIRRMKEIQVNDPASSQTLSQCRMGGSISWSPSDRYAQVIGQNDMVAFEEQRENQSVANPNPDQVPPSIPKSSHASRKKFDDSAADGAGAGVEATKD